MDPTRQTPSLHKPQVYSIQTKKYPPARSLINSPPARGWYSRLPKQIHLHPRNKRKVKPPLRGHPRDQEKCPLDGGIP